MSETATGRLARMLAMVPYISRRPGVALADLAAEFGVSTAQVGADLDLLMVCGLPGYYPDDLIDVVLDEEGGTVAIAFDAGIERPVRLTADEAVALTVALRALAELPGLVDASAVLSALAKLEGAGAAGLEGAGVRVAAADAAPALGTVRQGVSERRRMEMRYYTASRDQVTDRTVDPIRLLVTDGHSYLEAYCHLAASVRFFRVDRIDAVRLLDEPAQAPLWVDSDVPDRVFHPDPHVEPVTLALGASARWIAEYYPVEDPLPDDPDEATPERSGSSAATGGDAVHVRIRAGEDWLVRLVLSQGGAASFVDRPDLDAAVRDRATEALLAYRV
ncbi:WYL domain-containing protein [Nakamurella flavida]|uniref:WYL domain-containing protein n=1 Tax=Nakamurella flavida TaxID=363630 RepID=A0A938YHU6_9ACTN|nr:WYL domain-containing protein [Nakamurella flavida]MBM9475374.1 WYL domain-containing protein [Nakamurella flavida]MDP9776954.1 proteasome accessory factor C [Nakamurella flavida]